MEMKKIAFFDTKPYDKESFERQNKTLSLLVVRQNAKNGTRPNDRRIDHSMNTLPSLLSRAPP